MKFKPGDKVRLTQKFIDEMSSMGFTWCKEMVGVTMTIKEVVDYNGYSVAEAPYLVSELWIEEAAQDNRCQCYHDEQNFLHECGVCYGTKEKEPCSCGGNPAKCDFYEEVREKYLRRAKEEAKDDAGDQPDTTAC